MTDTAEVKTSNMETSSALPPEETERLGGEIVAALKTVFDPEIPADIYELGLIYKVDIKDDRSVDVDDDADDAELPGGRRIADRWWRTRSPASPASASVNVNLVWDPAWTPDRMTRRGAPRPQHVVNA